MTHHNDSWAMSTRAIALGRPDEPGAPLNVPPVPATNFILGGDRDYARDSNPTWEAFETVVGSLEGGRSTAFGSGMAAIEAAVAWAVAKSPEVVPLVAAPTIQYAGTRLLLGQMQEAGRITVHHYLGENRSEALTAAAAADVVLLESPANPSMSITDISAMAAATSGATICDNTYATALITRPLELGVDVVVQSASKYLAGHSDALIGVASTADLEAHEFLRMHRVAAGATPGVLEAWLATRGVRTLPLRLGAACVNAGIIAERLAAHPLVQWVRYPGLTDDPGHHTAALQMDMFGAMIAFGPVGGEAAADRIPQQTKLWRHATSLGGVESTLERRGRLSFEVAAPDLVRLSVGCEDVEDLWQDLDQALVSAENS